MKTSIIEFLKHSGGRRSPLFHTAAAYAVATVLCALVLPGASRAADLVVDVASGTQTFSNADPTITDRVVKTGKGTLVIPDDTYVFAGGFVISNGYVTANYEKSGLAAGHLDIVGNSSVPAVLQDTAATFTAPVAASGAGTVALLGYSGIAPSGQDLAIDFGGDGRTLVNGVNGFNPASWLLPASGGKTITVANSVDLNGKAFEFKPSVRDGRTLFLGAVTDSTGATAGSNVSFWEYGTIVFVGTRGSASPRAVDFQSYQFNNQSANVVFSNATIRVQKDFYMGRNASSVPTTKFYNCDKRTTEGWDFSFGKSGASTLVDGGTFHAGTQFYIGDNAARPHVVTITNDAALTSGNRLMFRFGTFNQESGSVAPAAGDSHIADAVGEDFTYNMRGGTLTFVNNDVLGYLGKALLHQTGGTVSVAKWFGIGRGNNGTDCNANGRLNVYGGSFTHQKPADNVMMRIAEYGTGTVAVAHGGVFRDLAVMGTSLANTGTGKATVLLHRGGTYEAAGFYNGTGDSALVFNGGTLRLNSARYASNLFPSSLKRVSVSALGGAIDTAGQGDFTITRPLAAPTAADSSEAALAHRWTFDDGSLADTAGSSDATIPSGSNVAWEDGAVRLLGTAHGTSRVNLGTDVLATDGTPNTIEMTFTINRRVNNARLFDIGSDGKTTDGSINDLWFCPHSLHSDSGKYYPLLRTKDNYLSWHLQGPVLEVGKPYHLTVVLVPNGTKMNFRFEIREAQTGTLVGRVPTDPAQDFVTTKKDVSMATGFEQANGFWLGYSLWNDSAPAITYHDIRVYHEELADEILAQSIADGAEAPFAFRKRGEGKLTLSGANAYRAATAVEGGTLALASGATLPATDLLVASGAVLDLGTSAQSVTRLEGTGTVRGGSLAVSGKIVPGGADAVGTLTLDGTALQSGTLVADFGSDGACDALVSTGAIDLSKLSLEFGDGLDTLDPERTYVLVRGAPVTGTFASVPVRPRGFELSYSAKTVSLVRPAFVLIVR